MHITFRNVGLADQPLLRKLTFDHMGEMIQKAWGDLDGIERLMQRMSMTGATAVVEADGEVAGHVYFTIRDPYLHIASIVIEKRFQGQGLGTACVAYAEDQAQRLGLDGLELWVQTVNPRAQQLYERLGFVTERVPRENTIEMRRPIHLPDDRLHLRCLLHTMVATARTGGQIIRQHFGARWILEDRTPEEMVTQANLVAEKAMISHLRTAYPNFGLHSREMGAVAQGEYTWIIDPLQGKDNFITGVPYMSTSVSLHVDGCTKMGVVYHPVLDECVVAEVGGGAWVNGIRLRARGEEELTRGAVSWIQGSGVGPGNSEANGFRDTLSRHCKRVIQTWAPTVDWCSVARGSLAALISFDSGPEDQDLGILIATEAGALVTDWSGKPPQAGNYRVLAAVNEKVHHQLMGLISSRW